MRITDIIPWRSSSREVAPSPAPSDPIGALQYDLDRAFDQFWQMVPYPFWATDRLTQNEIVRVDVADTGKDITVTAELPGMSETDIDVSISDGRLTIRGEKKADREAEDDGALIRERTFGVIERTVPLPGAIDPDAATATFSNGVLKITLPKSADSQATAKHIAVQAG